MNRGLIFKFLGGFLVLSFCVGGFSALFSSQVYAAYPSTLAETLNMVIGNVDWDYGNSWTTNWAIILAGRGNSVFDEAITADIGRGSYFDALYVARLAELNGYSSAVVSGGTETALQQVFMCGSLPITANAHVYGDPDLVNGGCYLVYHRFILSGYDYAESYGLTDKWDVSQGFADFAEAYDNLPIGSVSGEMLWCDPQENWARCFSSRYYDEHAQTLGVFLKFAQLGEPGALAYADSAWNGVQAHWNNPRGYYGYTSTRTVECMMGYFARIISEYKAEKGGTIPYWDRVILDLDYKLLVDGWSSPGWAEPGVIVHSESNPELRLWETSGAVNALHQLFPDFTQSMKESWADMLMGSSPAWKGLMDSGLNHDGFFSGTSSDGATNSATICAAGILFLDGIVPVTGSLAIPNRQEFYEDSRTPFEASDFKFDYANRLVRIPVKAGELAFIYGSTPVSYTFPADGVYNVKFSSDWNQITSVTEHFEEAQKVHLLLTVEPMQATYSTGQSVTSTVTVFNQVNEVLDSTLTLTVTGPSGFYIYDFQPIAVEANEVNEYSFSWVLADVAGKCVIEVGLVPPQLTAYDAAWLEVS